MQTLMLLSVVFIAAIARGYTGFGLSAIVVTVVSYGMPAKELVPLLILLELTASLLFVRKVSGLVNWQIVAVIFAGSAISTPLALLALTYLPTNATHALIASLVLLATVTLLLRKEVITVTGNRFWFLTGIAMGVFGGLGSIGGLAGMVLLLSTSMEPARARATMIVLLLITSVYAALFSAYNGLLHADTVKQLFLLLIPMAAGLYLGHYLFKHYNRSFRTITLISLSILSATMLAQSVFHAIT